MQVPWRFFCNANLVMSPCHSPFLFSTISRSRPPTVLYLLYYTPHVLCISYRTVGMRLGGFNVLNLPGELQCIKLSRLSRQLLSYIKNNSRYWQADRQHLTVRTPIIHTLTCTASQTRRRRHFGFIRIFMLESYQFLFVNRRTS